MRLLARFAHVEAHEWPPLRWSFAYFFCLLCGYYVLRPVRDEMGIQAGVGNLPWLLTATFAVMLAAVPLFGWVSSRFTRSRFIPYVYLFFATNVLAFYVLFVEKIALEWTTKAFFVWVSVFNLFVVSVFWSFMADLYHTAQAKRLYGLIAAGGSLGAICGPALTTLLAARIGPVQLLLISAIFLFGAVLCVRRLADWSRTHANIVRGNAERRVGGGMLDGVRLVIRSPFLLGICGYVTLFSVLSTFLYLEQQHIVKATIATPAERTQLFALIDLVVNVTTVAIQLLAYAQILKRFGLIAGLVAVPLLSVVGFIALGAAPTLIVLIAFGVLRRAAEFSVCKPARETLFNALTPEEKYKAKNFMDTAVYRAGDMASGWLFEGLRQLGTAMSGIAFLSAPLALLWAWLGLWLARRQQRPIEGEPSAPSETPTVRERFS